MLHLLGLCLLGLPALEQLLPVVDLHTERKSHVGEDFFDLLEGLSTEVLGLEHVLFGSLYELADQGDVRVLEAVGTPDAEFEFLDGAEEVLVQGFFVARQRLVAGFFGLFEVDPNRELFLQDLGGKRDGILRIDRAVGPHLEGEFVVVGYLSDARVLDGVVDFADRREQGVDRDGSDGHGGRLVSLGGDVASADVDREFHRQRALLIKDRDEMVGVQNLEAIDEFDVASVDGPRTFFVDPDGVRACAVRFEDDLFEVQDDVADVFDDVGHCGELVQSAFDADGGDGRALERGKQHAAERVADGDAEAAFERFAGELGVQIIRRLGVDGDALGADQVAPVSGDHRHVCVRRHPVLVLGSSARRSRAGSRTRLSCTAFCPRLRRVSRAKVLHRKRQTNLWRRCRRRDRFTSNDDETTVGDERLEDVRRLQNEACI